MKFRTTYLALAALVAAVAMPAWSQAGGTRLLGSPSTIDQPGAYALTRDIRVNAAQMTGFTITADGVTLDLNGHTIIGPGGKQGTGVMVDGAEGVEITNGSLSDLAFGVVVSNGNNVQVNHLRIRGMGLPVVALPPEVGIMLIDSRNVDIRDNAIYNTGLGIFVRGGGSGGNRLMHNTLTAGTNGVLGICYNPGPGQPGGPSGDLIEDNVVSGFNLGMQMKDVAHYNAIRNNFIAYRNQAIDLQNDTHIDEGNISVQLQ